MHAVTLISNPFDSAVASEHSNYCSYDGKRLVGADGTPPSPLTAFVHDGFRSLTLNEHFSCVGAKAAIRQGGYRFGLFEALGSPASCAGLAKDLFSFIQDRETLHTDFQTFVASFAGPLPADELAFERLLWATLQHLHELDAAQYDWTEGVAADTADPHFSFSFAQTAFFVVGLHAASSRVTRRFAWPTLIFNPHDQFDRLRSSGRYPRMQQVIREAERTLQGSVNPMLTEFGERSEASQYSGRQVGSDWQCPFHVRRDQPPGAKE
ncbi:MAG: YqcI/YcgG family protein [Acidobacteria bacterium]|nr:YqcI/YcgG family protein [Acidobacteriota bacterium]